MTGPRPITPAAAVPDEPEGDEPQGMFLGDIPFGFEVSEDGLEMVGDATLSDAFRSIDSHTPRPSVLATIADCAAGVASALVTSPQAVLTLDIVVRMTAERCGDNLSLAGKILKRGRSTVAGEIRFTDARTTQLVAISYLTFMASPRPQDLALSWARTMRRSGSMPVAFPAHVGVRSLSPGLAEIDRTPFVMQGLGTLQGGILALLAEVAAESLTRTRAVELDVRFLNTVRVGPARATATALSEDLVRVEVRDAGNDDRFAALVVAHMAR